jgi:hypothetical protein
MAGHRSFRFTVASLLCATFWTAVLLLALLRIPLPHPEERRLALWLFFPVIGLSCGGVFSAFSRWPVVSLSVGFVAGMIVGAIWFLGGEPLSDLIIDEWLMRGIS